MLVTAFLVCPVLRAGALRPATASPRRRAVRLNVLSEPAVPDVDAGDAAAEALLSKLWAADAGVDAGAGAAGAEEDVFCDVEEDAAPSADCVDLNAFLDASGDLVAVVGVDESSVFCDVECDEEESDCVVEDCVDLESFLAVEAEPDYGTIDSHLVVDLDEDGSRMDEAYAYVDEQSCVGCNLCAQIAPSTFFMEADYGNARAFRQHGDADEIIDEAVDACPVGCIKNVDFGQLEKLEVDRRTQTINIAGRLTARAEGRAPRTIIDREVDTSDPSFVDRRARREAARLQRARTAAAAGLDRIAEF